jgi:hypothetical protein
MLSVTLEQLVIPVFDEAGLSYHVHRDGQAITLKMNSSQATYEFMVMHDEKPGLLIVDCWNITKFEPRDWAIENVPGNSPLPRMVVWTMPMRSA